MTRSSQSPVVLVFLLSLDLVLRLSPSPLTPLQTGSQFLGGSPASLGRQPGLGSPLLAAGNATLSCSGSSGWAGPSTNTSVALQIPSLHPTGCRLLAVSCRRLVAAPPVQVVVRTLHIGGVPSPHL